MPPVLQLTGHLHGVERHNYRLAAIALADNFHAVGRVLARCHIHGESLANAPPARFFAAPLNAAAGPGQLIAIVQTTAGANDSIGDMAAWTFKNMSARPGMSGMESQ